VFLDGDGLRLRGFADQFEIHMGRTALRSTERFFPQDLHFPFSFTN